MTVAEFDKIIRPYLMGRAGDMRWEIRFRQVHLDRFAWLLKKDIRKEKQDKINQMLEDAESRIPFQSHLRVISQYKRLFKNFHDEKKSYTKADVDELFVELSDASKKAGLS